MENSKIKVNQTVALLVNIYQNSPMHSFSKPNEIQAEANEGKKSVLQESIKKMNNNAIHNEEEKLLGEISNMFTDKNKKVQEHEVINRELLAPHKYLLTIPKSQKILYKQFQISLREKYVIIGRNLLYLLALIYLIETLISTNAKIYSDYSILIFTFRGIFNFFILVTVYLYVQTNWKETYTYSILVIFLFGILTNIIETNFILYSNLQVVKLVEFILIFIIYLNLQ